MLRQRGIYDIIKSIPVFAVSDRLYCLKVFDNKAIIIKMKQGNRLPEKINNKHFAVVLVTDFNQWIETGAVSVVE